MKARKQFSRRLPNSYSILLWIAIWQKHGSEIPFAFSPASMEKTLFGDMRVILSLQTAGLQMRHLVRIPRLSECLIYRLMQHQAHRVFMVLCGLKPYTRI